MFLEINEKNKKNIIVYSRNKFDPEENFRIIYDNGAVRKQKKISYSDVCSLINYPSFKNIIVYRLLTNYNKIDAADSKHGIVITVDKKDELIYFDPVYALKDLENLLRNFNLQSFRFKIQQLGIKTISNTDGKENFTEIFSYDLHAVEAQNQNDKIFADALYPDEPMNEAAENGGTSVEPAGAKRVFNSSGLNVKNADENTLPENKLLKKARTENILPKPADKNEQKELLKRILGIDDSEDMFFITESTEKKDSDVEIPDDITCSDLFKKTGKTNLPEERGKDSIVLKLTIQ